MAKISVNESLEKLKILLEVATNEGNTKQIESIKKIISRIERMKKPGEVPIDKKKQKKEKKNKK